MIGSVRLLLGFVLTALLPARTYSLAIPSPDQQVSSKANTSALLSLRLREHAILYLFMTFGLDTPSIALDSLLLN
jgi:hypothetical protein